MAVVLNVKSVESLHGKADRIIKATFRGCSYSTKTVHSAKHVAYFGETFEWPVARHVESDETLEIVLYNYNKYLNNKPVGSFMLILQGLIKEGELNITEPLVDSNNRILDTVIHFDVKYYSPDGKIGNWSETDFAYPLVDQWPDQNGNDVASLAGSLEDRLDTASTLADSMSVLSGERSVLSVGQAPMGQLPGEDSAAHQAILDTMFNAARKRPEILAMELHRPRDFQVAITILEGQQLNGLNIDPVVKVQVGDDVQYTSIKQSTNNPFFNEYFVFDFHETPAIFFDKMITLTAYHARNIPGRTVWKAGNLLAGVQIGFFKCDLGTVYAANDHQYYHKWAVLLDPKDISEGPKGYVKCDISVLAKGDSVRPPKRDKDEDNIEGNLLLPAGVPMDRQRATYRVIIHRAEDVPRMDTGIVASVKKAMTLTASAFVDAYVKVSFVGHVGKTTVKKSYHPEWKEILTFVDMFPPLCNRIKIQLMDQDAISDDTIGTHFIELAQIMDPGGDSEGIIPTFGPTWVNFYGSPRNYKLTEPLDDLNLGIGEGAAYRGRLMVSLKTDLIEGEAIGPSTVYREKVKASGRVEVAPRREFLLFGSIFDISMIDKDYKDKPIYFELSIANYGNVLDPKGGKKIFENSDSDEDEEEDEDELTKLLQAREEREALPVHSTTEPQVPLSEDKVYYSINTDEQKPCLYVCCRFEDVRKRLWHENLLTNIAERMDDGLEDVRQQVRHDDDNPHLCLRKVMDELCRGIDNYMKITGNLNVGAGSGKTKLDKYRLKMCRTNMDKMRKSAKKLRNETFKQNVKEKYREARGFLQRLKHIAVEPQDSLPDVFLWMICDKKRVAFHRISSREILNATQADLQGKHCGKMQTIFLRKPGKKGMGQGGWAIQAKLLMYFWLGMRDTKRAVKDYMESLPKGYEANEETKKVGNEPPKVLVYKENQVFQLRAYIYQARSLIGSDDTGLSDPFARVIINNQCKATHVVDETLSPTWDETIIFDNVILSGTADQVLDNPPVVLVEIYDYDTVGQPEFLGRAIVKPRVKISTMSYEPPEWPAPLQWWDVYRGPREAGELLAAFELVQGEPHEFPELPPAEKRKKFQVVPLPPMIKPTLSKFRIEVLFWGVREPKRVQLTTVDRPRVDIEIAGCILHSQRMENIHKNSNFEDPLKYIDVMLPDNELFWPPLTILCVDCRNFGREVMVGTHTIRHIHKYIYVSPEEKRRKQEERLRKMAEERDKLKKIHDEIEHGGAITNGTVTVDVEAQQGTPLLGASVEVTDNNSKGPRSASDNSSGRHSVAAKSSKSVAIKSVKSVKSAQSAKSVQSVKSAKSGKSSKSALNKEPTTDQNGALPTNTEHVVIEMDATTVPDVAVVTQQTTPPPPPDGQKPGGARPSAEEQAAASQKRRKKRREIIADFDWWSKYYVTHEELEEEEDEYEQDLNDMFAAVNYEGMDQARLKELTQQVGIDDLPGDKKKRKKKKKKNKKKKERLKKLKGKWNDAFSKEDEEDDADLELGEKDDNDEKSFVQRMMIYRTELEKAADYNGFEDWIQTFDLFRGKKVDDEEDDHSRVSAKFKGMLLVYKYEDAIRETGPGMIPKLKLKDTLPPTKPADVNVRVYIVKGIDLHPVDLNGKSDPYLILKLGKKERNDKENKQFNTLNPVFGRVFEIDATFPMESILRIQVMDYDMMSADDLIGETVIDLESRFYSCHRGTCGLPKQYEIFGYNTWRDNMKPSQILTKLCKDIKIEPPEYSNNGEVRVAGTSFYAESQLESEHGELTPTNEHAALEVLKNWEHIPGGCKLIPEHIETRPLYNLERPGVEQGRLEMWIDLFPSDYPAPSVQVDITPRQPKSYELRCIIWNTDDVKLDDKNPLTGEASSDVFVRGFLKGKGEDDQDTDVHYRSLTGEGNFNWRFLFPFEYLKAEEKVVVKKKEGVFAMEDTESKVPCVLTLQVWDADLVSADDFLGGLTLNLNKLPRPAKSSKKCSLKMLAKDGSVPTFNLFKQLKCKGWWPMEAFDDKEGDHQLVGKVEAELHLLTAEEAEKMPAGKAREDPDGLPEPNRPDSSFLWFMNPLKTLKYIIWRNYKWLIIKLIILLILLAFFILFLYSAPGELSKLAFGTA